jgi:serine/threonine-protein kinase
MSVVHRDVSPKNVMITYGGQVKMIDFGIAKARGRLNRTQVGIVKGTTGYMAPEQVKNETLDGRTDLFAVGVMLHELVCGERLFKAATDTATMLKIVQEEPRDPTTLNPAVSPELGAVILKALAKDRNARFATGKELARALEHACPELHDDEQVAELMAQLFDDKLAATRALLDVAKPGTDPSEVNQAVEVLASSPVEERTPATPSPRAPPRASVSRLPKVATGAHRTRSPSATGKSARLPKVSRQDLPVVAPGPGGVLRARPLAGGEGAGSERGAGWAVGWRGAVGALRRGRLGGGLWSAQGTGSSAPEGRDRRAGDRSRSSPH